MRAVVQYSVHHMHAVHWPERFSVGQELRITKKWVIYLKNGSNSCSRLRLKNHNREPSGLLQLLDYNRYCSYNNAKMSHFVYTYYWYTLR